MSMISTPYAASHAQAQKQTESENKAQIAKLQKLAASSQNTIDDQKGQVDDLTEDIKDLETRNHQLKVKWGSGVGVAQAAPSMAA